MDVTLCKIVSEESVLFVCSTSDRDGRKSKLFPPAWGDKFRVSASLVKLREKIFLIVAMQKYYGFTKIYTSRSINTFMERVVDSGICINDWREDLSWVSGRFLIIRMNTRSLCIYFYELLTKMILLLHKYTWGNNSSNSPGVLQSSQLVFSIHFQ